MHRLEVVLLKAALASSPIPSHSVILWMYITPKSPLHTCIFYTVTDPYTHSQYSIPIISLPQQHRHTPSQQPPP